MKICFVLPAISRVPIGGYKMVYEYANRFAMEQNEVHILFMNRDALQRYHLPVRLKKILSNLETVIEPRWFNLNGSILKISTNEKKWFDHIKDVNVIIATAVETMDLLEEYFPNARKVYFIQDYENWNVSDEIVKSTYSKGYTNIVISSWLKEIVDENSLQPSILIKNPIDLNVYRIVKPLNTRKKHTISLLYHKEKHKGVKFALEALYRLHELYTDLEVYMFGVFDYKDKLSPWIHYTRRASQQQTVDIYNKTCIFLCATIEEGYGLTGLEAIACGNVLVSTDYCGVREYARDGYNSLLCPIKDINTLVSNVQRLFEDDELREKLAKNGQESVQEFSWDRAYDQFRNAVVKSE